MRRAWVKMMAVVLVVAMEVAVVFGEGLCRFDQGAFYTRRQVMECFESVEFTESMRVQTVDTMSKTKELYAFVDIAVNSPDPNLPLQVNLEEELQRIAKTQYQNALTFHDDLRALYTSLNDAHTQYYLPMCFRNFLIRQPIPPTSYVTKDTNVIAVSRYMSYDLIDYFNQTTSFDITQLIGAEIVKVDDVNALEYFETYSQSNIGMSKDAGTRFHLGMTQPQPQPFMDVATSSYWQTRTKRNPLPESDSTHYVFLLPNGTYFSQSFEWTYKALKTYVDRDAFLADYWASTSQAESQNVRVELWDGDEVKLTPIQDVIQSKPRSSTAAFTPILNSDDVYFWALNDSKTMVMYLNTMAPTTKEQTYLSINKAFTWAAENGITQLVIDLTNNGGGSICFGRSLLAYFQGHANEAVNWGPQDLPLSPLQANLTTSAVDMNVSNTVWSPGFYRDEDGNHVPNDDIEVIMPGVPYVRGGLLRNYSNLVHINDCGFWGYFIEPEKDFAPDDIIIITHGFCGSTCALVANHAAIYDGVKTVVAGGLASRKQQQYSSFPGLQVLDDPDLFAQFDELGGDTTPGLPTPDEVIPRRLPTTANFRYCIREIYPPEIVTDPTTAPMEFNFQAATWKLDDSLETAEDPEWLWYAVLPLFG